MDYAILFHYLPYYSLAILLQHVKKVIKVLGRGVPKRLKPKKTKHVDVDASKGPRRCILNLFVRKQNKI